MAVATIGWFRRTVDASVAQAPNVRTVLEPAELESEPPLTRFPTADPQDLAFIQYTSGSTGHPRGVMLTHENVVSTCRFMAEAAGLTAEDRVVSWLPLYHDMGLIGCSFTPPLKGTPLWLLPPDLRNPRQWLELVTKVRATFTVSPDFGYRNCVRNVSDKIGPGPELAARRALRGRARARLDDSSLRGALRDQGRHRALLWPGRGDAGRRHLALRGAHPARPHRPLRLRGPSLPRRAGEDRRPARR